MSPRSIGLVAAALVAASTVAVAGELKVGDPAPKITVSSWVKGDPVPAFQKDHLYVVEFWATWCGPCKRSIPHLTELQKEYAEDNVTFIGVSVWESDPSKVEPFVEEMGDKMAYTVAKDLIPEGAESGVMAETWMAAAGQKGIPAAFIVGRDGKIAWIGHPMSMDEPLEGIVAGTWTPEKANADAKREDELNKKASGLYEEFLAAKKAGEHAQALQHLDAMIALDPGFELRFGPMKFEHLLLSMKDYDAAYAYGAKLVDGPAKKDPGTLNSIAWTIVDPEAQGIAKKDLALALRAATRANELTEDKDPAILDTLAAVHFERGELDKAIEVQEKAVRFSEGTQFEEELKSRLDRYQKIKRESGKS
jgi:thiol-disulfide isomerase/thioredoxin